MEHLQNTERKKAVLNLRDFQCSILATWRISALTGFRLLGTVLLISIWASAQDRINYTLEYSKSSPKHIHVTILPSDPIKGTKTLVIPRAIPSGYAMQFYDRYVENVTATSNKGKNLIITREDGPRWRIGKEGAKLAKVEYDVNVYQMEQEIFDAADTSKVRSEYLGLLGYSTLGYLEGTENIAVKLQIRGPSGWKVFSTLSPKVPADKTKTVAEAENFFGLADSQIIMGKTLKIRKLKTSSPLFMVVYTETETDIAKHAEVFKDAFQKVLTYFGDAPFKQYTGYIEILKPLSKRHQYGFSMEHLKSSTYFLGLDRSYKKTTPKERFERDRFNYVHHIAHSWIPKQVYGKGYKPFIWELPPQIDTIWFNEGFARLIAIEAMSDSMPKETREKYRKRQLKKLRTTLKQMPKFIREMSLLKLSRIGSMMYGADFRTGQTLYIKGALMANEMDQLIRKRTKGQKRLRDSLRSLVKWGQKSKRPFRIEELPKLIAMPVGVEEQEITSILKRWLTPIKAQKSQAH